MIQGQDNLYVGVQRDLHDEGDPSHVDLLLLLLMSVDVELATSIGGSILGSLKLITSASSDAYLNSFLTRVMRHLGGRSLVKFEDQLADN